jgi:hypothetical protein
MKRTIFSFSLILTLVCGSFATSFAGYAIHLKNGRTLTASKVWEENATVYFNWEGGAASFPRESVASIERVKDSGPTRPSAAKADEKLAVRGPQSPAPAPQTKNPDPNSSSDIKGPEKEMPEAEAIEQKKAAYTEKFNEAHKRYLEACSTRDEEGKKKAWGEITYFSGQVNDLKEALKKKGVSKKEEQP